MVDNRDDQPDVREPSLGFLLREAWLGYQERIDETLQRDGIDRGYADMRVIRLCSRMTGLTVSAVGRELGITRQRAAKLVSRLVAQGLLVAEPSSTDQREKHVAITPIAEAHLSALKAARRGIDRALRESLGEEALDAVRRVAESLTASDGARRHAMWRRIQHATIADDDGSSRWSDHEIVALNPHARVSLRSTGTRRT